MGGRGGGGRGGGRGAAGFSFSAEAGAAPALEAEPREVGELQSDWLVSEASEEPELGQGWSRVTRTHTHTHKHHPHTVTCRQQRGDSREEAEG